MIIRQAQAEQAVRRENAMYFVEAGQGIYEFDRLEDFLGLKNVNRGVGNGQRRRYVVIDVAAGGEKRRNSKVRRILRQCAAQFSSVQLAGIAALKIPPSGEGQGTVPAKGIVRDVEEAEQLLFHWR